MKRMKTWYWLAVISAFSILFLAYSCGQQSDSSGSPGRANVDTNAAKEVTEFGPWSAPVNLGSVVNSPYLESCVAVSKDGLSLFFSSNRQTGITNSLDRDLYVSKRGSIDAPWGTPVPLTMLNTSGWESCPALSLDEHLLYFSASHRPGGCGKTDIWVSRRHDRRDDFGWGPPINLGCEENGYLNSSNYDSVMPTFFEDESGQVWMYFCRGVLGAFTHIYQSEMRSDGTFGPATLVTELTSGKVEQGATVRRDGREVLFLSNRDRSASYLLFDFWRATRTSTSDPWSAPEYVPSLGIEVPNVGNLAFAQGRIAMSFDSRELYFTSYRPGPDGTGWADLWVATREKLKNKKE